MKIIVRYTLQIIEFRTNLSWINRTILCLQFKDGSRRNHTVYHSRN